MRTASLCPKIDLTLNLGAFFVRDFFESALLLCFAAKRDYETCPYL